VPLTKLLVANRGEIAIRAFRAAHQLGIGTVAVHAWEDRTSLHRQKADEAYQIGERGHPVRAYLNIEELVDTAVQAGADALYPGYGFLSENPDLAEACSRAGIVFVGPTASALELTANKMRARQAAAEAELPVLNQSDPISTSTGARHAAEHIGYPLFVKATSGGGGRGLRRVERPDQLDDALAAASREAEAAFGDGSVFLEEALTDVRHIEVQVLADGTGEVVHLFERDCSVQRRFQKVIEVAPARDLDPAVRARLCSDSVRFARKTGYRSAGTVELLVNRGGRAAFIEMNPRIQVEHTITEEVTDVDLLEAQLRIAGGETLGDLGLRHDRITVRGFAIQFRVTTEDPAHDFRPDTGRISAYRQPGGPGIRLDGGGAYVGSEVSPWFNRPYGPPLEGPDPAEKLPARLPATPGFPVHGAPVQGAAIGPLGFSGPPRPGRGCGIRYMVARYRHARGDRHDAARRASVHSGHQVANDRPRRRGRPARGPTAGSVELGVLGWRDL